jgi:hypothetical protein
VTAAPQPARAGYPGSSVAAAALATVFFPVLSLIAALFLIGRVDDPARRRDLRTWAWASAGWILAQIAVFLLFALAVFSGSSSGSSGVKGPCVGGPDLGQRGIVRPDGSTVLPCAISGTATVTLGK